ncbi:MAG: M23 family metallopeptidase [Candidatus Spechtbacterales bacterium]
MNTRRQKIFFVAAWAAISGIILLGVWFFDYRDESGEGGERGAEEIVEEKFRLVEYMVEDGDTWEKIMAKIGMDWNLGLELLMASQGAHNLASIHAGNELRLRFDSATGELAGAEYDIDDEQFLAIKKNDAGQFVGESRDIEYEIETAIKTGVIESSLFETARQEGIPPGIILEMARIFGWDVDFTSSVQAGDDFIVAYEERFRAGEKVKPGKILASRFTNSRKDFYAFFYEDPSGYAEYYNHDGREMRRQFLRSPLDYKRITSSFSYNRFHPILNTFTTHRAIDYAAAAGTSVSATAHGTVTYVGWKGGNGNYVGMKHANGYSTGYAHLSAFAKGTKVGAKVTQNQVVGFVGSTGLSTGPHLHYEMLKNGVLINPLAMDLPPGKPVEEEYIEDFYIKRDELMGMIQK